MANCPKSIIKATLIMEIVGTAINNIQILRKE